MNKICAFFGHLIWVNSDIFPQIFVAFSDKKFGKLSEISNQPPPVAFFRGSEPGSAENCIKEWHLEIRIWRRKNQNGHQPAEKSIQYPPNDMSYAG